MTEIKADALKSFEDYNKMAQEFSKKQPILYDRNNMFWLWNGFSWEMCDEIDLFNQLKQYFDKNFAHVSVRSQAINSLKDVGREAWDNLKELPKTWLQFKDKFVDYKTGEEIPVSPEYFAVNPISWNLGDSEETPVLDKLFIDWVGAEHKKKLFQIFAYSLLPDYPIQRSFILNGVGSNGKDTFLNVMRKFIGDKNCTASELDTLLYSRKKLVCTIGETNFAALKKTNVLKSLTGRGSFGFEFKNKTPFSALNYAKIIIATNRLPLTFDKSDGFYRRILIIDFPNRFSEKRDVLSEIPDAEFENLALKSIRILRELIAEGGFDDEGSITERMKRYEERSNPIKTFIQEHCEDDESFNMPFSLFYEQLNKNVKGRALSRKHVSNAIKRLGFETEKKTVKKSGKVSSEIIIQGVRLKGSMDSIDSMQLSLSSSI